MFNYLNFLDTSALYVDKIDMSRQCVDFLQFYRHIIGMCRSGEYVDELGIY